MDSSGALRLKDRRAYKGDDFAGLEPVIEAYRAETGAPTPEAVAFGLAGPVRGDVVRMTRRDWTIRADGVQRAAGAQRALLVNDFAAAALSLPYVTESDIVPLGGPARAPDLWTQEGLRALALGPGTGLGNAILSRRGGVLSALDTEGGHASFAAWDEETWAVVKAVTAHVGQCAIENLASGPGLSHLYAVLSGGDWDALVHPADIRRMAAEGDAAAARAASLLCEILGAAAGDLALASGARDGVFILGGVALSLKEELEQGGFRARFEARPDFPDYLRGVPTALVNCPHAGLIGAAAALVPQACAITVED